MNSKYVKISDARGLEKDITSKAIINTDVESLTSYRKQRESRQQMDEAIREINTLKKDFQEIKSLLGELIVTIGGNKNA